MNFLIVGNDPYYNFLARSELRRYYNVKNFNTAMTGEKAQELALLSTFDMILIDYQLPDSDGLSVIKNMRSKGISNPAVLLIKGRPSDSFLHELSRNNVDYIIKDLGFSDKIISTALKLSSDDSKEIKKRKSVKERLEAERIDTRNKTSMTISHEVNNALTTIIGATQLLQEGNYELTPKVKEKIKIIEDSAHRIKETLVKMSSINNPISVKVPNGRMYDLKTSI
ncbi:MAG: response regulator [candidate division Zixibacteria bacterium]|nr:response regulator [candidate division Zixibacteria bacterium]